jgi:ribosomal protein S18 acetylase RimI-like enzyme
MTKASLGVDAENLTGAVGLYERAGMTVERRNDVYRKQL